MGLEGRSKDGCEGEVGRNLMGFIFKVNDRANRRIDGLQIINNVRNSHNDCKRTEQRQTGIFHEFETSSLGRK